MRIRFQLIFKCCCAKIRKSYYHRKRCHWDITNDKYHEMKNKIILLANIVRVIQILKKHGNHHISIFKLFRKTTSIFKNHNPASYSLHCNIGRFCYQDDFQLLAISPKADHPPNFAKKCF